MLKANKSVLLVLSVLVVLACWGVEVWGVDPEPIEGRIIDINEKRGTITINGHVLDASDFELADLKVGNWVIGQFVREKGKLRLIDLEVIKEKLS
jgi:hypothetical protein